jgi:hypothetical protein
MAETPSSPRVAATPSRPPAAVTPSSPRAAATPSRPPAAETAATATLEDPANIATESERSDVTPPAAEAAPESGRARRSDRADGAPKSRRRSSAPPPPRSSGVLPFALGAAVFAVMFLAGAMRAMREEPTAAKPSARPTSTAENIPVQAPAPPLDPVPAAVPSVVAQADPLTEDTAAPPASAAEPAASTSGEPAGSGDTIRVMLRSAVAGAKFYRYGKQVGMNSVMVELAPGEKRAFEVDLQGYVPRKVIVDGSRSEVVVILPRISEAPDPGVSGAASSSPNQAAPKVSSAP